jgi:WD40 repeat protein
VRIDVVRPFNKPTPEPLPELDDWVGCIGAGGVDGLLAAGLYNGAVCLSRIPAADDGGEEEEAHEQLVSASAHEAPVKGIAHMAAGGGRHWLVSASKDCTLRTWQYAKGDGAPSCTAVCSGHTDAVDCVQACPAASRETALFASGSWDKTVKLWESPLVAQQAGVELPEILPKASLDGHTQAVSCICWRQADTIYRYPLLLPAHASRQRGSQRPHRAMI